MAGIAIGVLAGGIGPPVSAHAERVCVFASVYAASGLVSQSTPQVCLEQPLPTRPLHVEDGVQPHIWVVVDVWHP